MTRENSRNVSNAVVISLVLIALVLTPPLVVQADTNYIDTFDSAFGGPVTSLTTGSPVTGLNFPEAQIQS